jgi:GAF domain-containing protein
MVPGERSPGAAEIAERRLLQSIVEVSRRVFGAAAASIFLVDPQTGEFVFEAVSGEGETHLLGRRFPPDTGIAGWVAASGQPVIIDDLAEAPQFAHDAAASTGYVPRSLMAAPLIQDEECIGVLEVLDRSTQFRGELADVDLLSLLAVQAACGLDFLLRLRLASAGSAAASDLHTLLDRIAVLAPRNGAADPTAVKLLTLAEELLR